MGNIFRVSRPDRTAPMIMKVPRVGVNEPAEGIIGFKTEATIVPALSVYVPHCLAVGDLARTPYLVTDWVDGTSLEQLVALGVLPPAIVAEIGASMADALHSLHRQDAIHLDLKPANVIVKPYGTVVLVDFGFARHVRYPDLMAEETRFSAPDPRRTSRLSRSSGAATIRAATSSRSASCCTRWPGALFRALGAFAMFEIDLAEIESRPVEGKPWEYAFYLDLIGELADPKIEQAMSKLRAMAEVLGCYRTRW